MIRFFIYCLTIALSAVASPSANATRPPSQLVLEGVGTIPLAAHARRTYLLAAVQRYTVAVYVNGWAHHDLMLAFLDHWLGQRPVSEDLKRTLLAPS